MNNLFDNRILPTIKRFVQENDFTLLDEDETYDVVTLTFEDDAVNRKFIVIVKEIPFDD